MRPFLYMAWIVLGAAVLIRVMREDETRAANVTVFQRFYDPETLMITNRMCLLQYRVELMDGHLGVSAGPFGSDYEVIVGIEDR